MARTKFSELRNAVAAERGAPERLAALKGCTSPWGASGS